MAENEKLTTEEADVRNQPMLQDLQRVYAPVDEAQSLERIRKRLLVIESTHEKTSKQFVTKTIHERILSMSTIQTSDTRKRGRYLTFLVAGIVAALLVGSLLLIVKSSYLGGTGGSGGSSAPIIKATPTLEPKIANDPAWKTVTTFKGVGSTTIKIFDLKFPYALGAFFTCSGKGNTNVTINGVEGKAIGFDATCQASDKGLFNVSQGAHTVEIVYIVTSKNNSWELQLESCVDKNSCIIPKPTVAPGSPKPTAVPGSPKPTAVPGSPNLTVVPGSPKPTVVPAYPTAAPSH